MNRKTMDGLIIENSKGGEKISVKVSVGWKELSKETISGLSVLTKHVQEEVSKIDSEDVFDLDLLTKQIKDIKRSVKGDINPDLYQVHMFYEHSKSLTCNV